jgi:predicted dehydrogenase
MGLVGAGVVAERHIAAIAEVSEVRVVAVTDVDPDRAHRLADRAGAAAVGDLLDLLDRPDVEVVVLTVPHALHADLAVRAAVSGRHLLVEKPLATTVADCDRIIAAAEAAGVLLWVGQQQRQFQQVRAARELLRDGAIGTPLLYSERRSNDYSRDGTRPAWFTDFALAGGGIAMLVGVHTIDRASWLLDARPVAVAGTTATPEGWQIETDAAGTIWFDTGCPAHFAWHSGRDFYHETVIVGERGQLRLDPSGLTVVDANGGTERPVEFDADREYTLSFARQYRALARTLRDGAPPEITPAEGRAAVATVHALYASAREGGDRTSIS